MEYQQITYSVADGIARMTLARPEKLNAIGLVMEEEITHALTRVRQDPEVRVLVVAGEGRAFSAGHDLNEVYQGEEPYALNSPIFLERRRGFERLRYWQRMLWDLPQTVIAQVHGYCYNVAAEFAMNCDLVIAAHDAQFVTRPLGGAGRYYHMWPWLVGLRKAKEFLLTGEPVNGRVAAEYGMINSSVELADLPTAVDEMARRVAATPLEILALEKQCVNKCFEFMGMLHGMEYTMELHAMSHLTDEGLAVTDLLSEGWRKAIERRDARYADTT
jgi:enoyl-CoA hydratase